MNLRKILSIVLLLGLLILSVSCVSKGTYEATKSELSETQTQLQTTQAELRTNQEQLQTTQAELTKALSQIEQLQTTQAELRTNQEQLKSTEAELTEALSQIEQLNMNIAQLEEQLSLYKELGISVYSEIQPNYIKTLLTPVKLSNNSSSANPTMQQLRAFLEQDKTDQKDYDVLFFKCGNYAEEVHNNAESTGTRSAFVVVKFIDGDIPHALNAFITTDNGLVFVDCTSSHRRGGLDSKLSSYDKIAYITKGKELGLISLDIATSLEYSFYEEYEQKWEQYEIEVEEYNTLYSKCGGYAIPGECEQLLDKHTELEQLSAQLGETSWESPGVVASIEIYW